jgi:Skp family chaperone for outer membrane proteins
MSEQFGKLLDRVSSLIGVLGAIGGITAAVAVLWLQSNFLTRTEFDEHRKETYELIQKMEKNLSAIEKTLAVMVEADKHNSRQDTILQDHEQRLRSLERQR